ncbi:MAG: hypothetical protein IIC06_05965, partial [Proteobacteria bacterium]|nr:hypothetical protein [Pseudomonadota bacterium]
MSQTTNFEVQVQQGGQWTIHENFKAHQRDAAIEEAKKILNNVEAVKVLKEVLDPDTGVFNDSIIFKDVNEGRIAAAKKAKTLRRTGARGDDARRARSSKRRGGKHTSSMKSIVVKLLLVVLGGLCLAAAFAGGATEILAGRVLFGVRITGSAESNLLIGIFIVTFLISAPVLAIFFLRGVSLKSSSKGKLGSLLALAVYRMMKPLAATKKSAKATTAANRRAAPPTPSSLEPSSQALSEAEQQAKAAEDKVIAERLQAELEKEKEKEKEESAAEESAEEPAPEPEAEADSEQAQALSPEAENLKVYMLEFLTKALKGSQADIGKMDSFNKFGVSLYMAGACDILSQKGKMDLLSRSKILAESVQILGFKKSHAHSFAERYEEYLMADSRYMQMFQAGRNGINIYLADESAAPRLLATAFTEWNKPKTVEEQSG